MRLRWRLGLKDVPFDTCHSSHAIATLRFDDVASTLSCIRLSRSQAQILLDVSLMRTAPQLVGSECNNEVQRKRDCS